MGKESIEKDLDCCDEIIKTCEGLLCLDFKTENTSKELLSLITELKSDLTDQQNRVKKDTYEIAVVGREKSGKSSLLNAWIRFDLLPSERKRCTYTTTEIRSCSNPSEQKYSIEFFSKQEFESKLQSTINQLNNSSGKINRDRDLLEQEMNEIEQLSDEIHKYLGRETIKKSFKSFEEVRKELKAAISDPGQARAIRKVCIWTPILNSADNLVLYDVPGYDSPITLHKEQTKAKIASVDAILYAKEFKSPDLVDSEIEILKISDASNPYIKAKDKIIVALTCCDVVNSPREYNELVAQNQNAWKVFGVSTSRVVPVCSIAELNPDSVEASTVMMRLKTLNSGQSGFKELKNAVKSCIEDSKNKIAQDRCEELKNKIKDFSNRLSKLIKLDFNIDVKSEVKETLDDTEMEKIYNEWWAKQWKHIHEDFQLFYQTVIRPKADPDAPAYLSVDAVDFKKSYEDIIERTFKSIPSTRRERQKAIYISCSGDDGVVFPTQGNSKIRTELSREAINSIDRVTHELAVYSWKCIAKIIGWIQNKLYNMPEIRKEMIGTDESVEESLMKKAFDALIQRLARPATDIFLCYPRSKLIRLKILREYQMELMILDNFVENGKLKSRGIIPFIAHGRRGKFQFDVAYNELMITKRKNENNENKEEGNGSKEASKAENGNKQTNLKPNDDKDNISLYTIESKGEIKRRPFFRLRRPRKEEIEATENYQISKSQENISAKPQEKLIPVITKDGNKISSSTAEDAKSTDLSDDMLEDFNKFELPKKDNKQDLDDQFIKLTFSDDSCNLEQIYVEIENDLEEFIACMKNSVFYGSGIQRFYNQELDKFRRKFIELEEDKHRWFHLVSKYLKLNDPKIKIPAPKMSDEIANRRQLINGTQKINELIEKL